MKIENDLQLRELYGSAKGRAKHKQLSELEKHSIHFVGKSPFVVISTFDKKGGVDTSPRGGQPGFVKVLDKHRLAIPDSKGNNRTDSMNNILESGRIGTLFLMPGIDETLRINGSASVSAEGQLLSIFAEERNPPKTCILIEVEEVFLHCAKALMRSKLWSVESKVDRGEMPSMGQMLNDQLGITESAESQEAMLKRYQNEL
ncbi:pyridoxamine 5'-phosphate oxidase family protein [Pseudomonadota bacterium]